MIDACERQKRRNEIFRLNQDLAAGAAEAGAVQRMAVELFDFLQAKRELRDWERAHLRDCAVALETNWLTLALSHLWLALEPPEDRCKCAEAKVQPARLRAMLAGA